MNKSFRYILSLCAALLVLGGCKEETPATYTGETGIFFFRGNQYIAGDLFTQYDSLNLSFVNVDDDENLISAYIDVRTSGMPAGEARKIVFEQTNVGETGAAVAGKHFVPFDDASLAAQMVMPAGEVRALIPVVLKRDATLEKGKYSLKFRLVLTDDFRQTIEGKDEFTVTTTAKYEKPSEWDSWWGTALGEWGPKKMWFIVQIVGFNEMDSKSSAGFRTALKTRATELLTKYNKEHGELREEPEDGGQPVKF